ncbi:Hsp20/alpha crystallin family protein [Streptomyces sp. APSN-46.1]|nr:Hsp20/alpha crystallin family protein [Streptomyces sp. APSN-46.1]
MELPGVPGENVDIEIDANELCISGEISEEQRGKVLSRRSGKFYYCTSMPAGADSEHVDADLSEGILTVRIPKTGESKRRKVKLHGKDMKKDMK